MSTPTQARVSFLGVNLLSFIFNYDNYVQLPVLFPRITSPDFANDSAAVYGWVGAGFSIAAVFGSLLFGAWADGRGAREPLFAAQITMLIGDIICFLRLNMAWNVLLGRVIAGIGAGSRTACLWYISRATKGAERGKAIGNWYAVGMLGMVLAPAIAAACASAPTPASAPVLSVNAYNAPILSSMVLHLLGIFWIHRYVKPLHASDGSALLILDIEDDDLEGSKEDGGENSSSAQTHGNPGAPFGCFVLVLCQYLMVTGISSFETVVVPLFSSRFNTPAYVPALVFVGIGVLVLISAIVSGGMNQKGWEERQIEMLGLTIFVLGCVLSFDFTDITWVMVLLEVLSTVLIGIGFTFAFCMQPSLFSKLIMNHEGGALLPRMGKYMAWLSMAGSAAKISGPLVVGYGLDALKNEITTAINVLVAVIIGCGVVAAIAFGLSWGSLFVPGDNEEGEAEDSFTSSAGNDQIKAAYDTKQTPGLGDPSWAESLAHSTRSLSMAEGAFSDLLAEGGPTRD